MDQANALAIRVARARLVDEVRARGANHHLDLRVHRIAPLGAPPCHCGLYPLWLGPSCGGRYGSLHGAVADLATCHSSRHIDNPFGVDGSVAKATACRVVGVCGARLLP